MAEPFGALEALGDLLNADGQLDDDAHPDEQRHRRDEGQQEQHQLQVQQLLHLQVLHLSSKWRYVLNRCKTKEKRCKTNSNKHNLMRKLHIKKYLTYNHK